jgi:hypothetical protein
MVGDVGFEPTISRSQTERINQTLLISEFSCYILTNSACQDAVIVISYSLPGVACAFGCFVYYPTSHCDSKARALYNMMRQICSN